MVTVSVVIPIFNEQDNVEALYAELHKHTTNRSESFEFIFVDDGSRDATAERLRDIRCRDRRTKFIVLSRNFGHQAALSAGLAHAAGDAIIMMDGDLQHPPALIPELLRHWHDGFDVVQTRRLETEDVGFAKKVFSSLFYRLFNWASSTALEPGAADFRLISRPVLDALNSLPERHRFLRGLVPWLGFRSTHVDFVAPKRHAGVSKYNVAKQIRLALDGMTAFSSFPLRRVTLLGWAVVAFTLAYAVYALLAWALGYVTVPGWTSLLLCTLFFGGCQMLTIGILGEYVGRIWEQVKGRPILVTRQKEGFDEQESAPRWRAAG